MRDPVSLRSLSILSAFVLLGSSMAPQRRSHAQAPHVRRQASATPDKHPAARPAAAPAHALGGAARGDLVNRGDYADSFLPLKPQVRDYERDPANQYTYCIRSTAVYECLSYG